MSFSDPVAYEAFVEDPGNDLLAIREHRNIRFAAQYLPTDLIRWKNNEQSNHSSSENQADQALAFILNIGPATDAKTGDVMVYGVSSMEDYARRMEQMNFRLEESIELRIGEQLLKPRLVHMENTYGLTQDRNIHLAFETETPLNQTQIQEDLDLVFDDPVFGTGINHFRIPKEALNSLPRLDI